MPPEPPDPKLDGQHRVCECGMPQWERTAGMCPRCAAKFWPVYDAPQTHTTIPSRTEYTDTDPDDRDPAGGE